ncbi:MAG: ATP-binding protein [Actinobacteria bacterium]|nr:MAG: ATP-binding protein [Actinomycetota bacterium]
MTSARKFRCRPEAVTAARLWVRDHLRGQPLEVVHAAELLTSELAANSVRHACSEFEVAIDSRDAIRIEVSDSGEGRPTVLYPPPRTPSGRGLQIVERTADAWGVRPTPDGKAVWFRLARAQGQTDERRKTA